MSRQYGFHPGHAHGTRTPNSPGDPLEYGTPPGTDSHPLRDIDNHTRQPRSPSPSPYPYSDHHAAPPPPPHFSSSRSHHSQTSLAPLTGNHQYSSAHSPTPSNFSRSATPMAAAAGGAGAYGYQQPVSSRGNSYYGDAYDSFDPSTIDDDGDDGLDYRPRQRNSRMGMSAAAGAGAGAGAGVAKAFGHSANGSGHYDPVRPDMEKSYPYVPAKDNSSKKRKWIIGCSILVVLVVGGIIGGVVGGIISNRESDENSGRSGNSGGSRSGALYDINSKEVKAVLNNNKLHKVFPTIDYTPFYAQYPACLSPGGGPDQNNVTLDIAMLSQLAPAVRLYGTDCNQTEMVLEAIDRLDMKDSMKLWLGVHLDGNQTTNDRQLSEMWRILDKYDHDRFVGVIVGNEVLYAKFMTLTELAAQLQEVRDNFTTKGIQLPVSTADLGDNWDANLASASDQVLSNIHPYFAGVVAENAASWAWSFWQNKDVSLTSTTTGTIGQITYPKQIIAEIGWPTKGGNNCGVATDARFGCTSDTDGSVATLDNLNTFMDGWVCDAMNNGTTYFWFEAFDEPWKQVFDTEYNKWEPYWGIFDSNRNLKDGIKIPDCGGKTMDKAY